MDDELYQLPNSPMEFRPQMASFQSQPLNLGPVPASLNYNNASQTQSNPNPNYNYQSYANPVRSDLPKPASRLGSVSQSLYNQSTLGTTNANLSNLLNIPDSFVDQYKLATDMHPPPSQPLSQQDQMSHSVSRNPSLQDSMDFGAVESLPEQHSPFTEYANPNSAIYAAADAPRLRPQLSNIATRPSRRRIVTTFDYEPNDYSMSLKKDDEYLYNPGISPSKLVNGGFADDFNDPLAFFVSSQFDLLDNFQNGVIPGFENDYLFNDAFDEEVEGEDFSEDEDEDNYFLTDEDEDMVYADPAPQNYLAPADTYVPSTAPPTMVPGRLHGGYLDEPKPFDGLFSNVTPALQPQPPVNDAHLQNLQYNHQQGQHNEQLRQHYLQHQLDTHIHDENQHGGRTAAEISAENPNHECDVVNPNTGMTCGKQFSRPYDLIRHQETVHATKKKIFRCVICEGRRFGGPGNGKEKTFSRGDALSRHIKVKHLLGGDEALSLINEAKANVEYVFV